MINYNKKYIKYKLKYINLKKELCGGMNEFYLNPYEKYKTENKKKMEKPAVDLCIQIDEECTHKILTKVYCCKTEDKIKYYNSLIIYNKELEEYNNKIKNYKESYQSN